MTSLIITNPLERAADSAEGIEKGGFAASSVRLKSEFANLTVTLRNVSLLYRILNDENRLGTFDVKQNIYASGGGFRPDKDARTTPRRKRPTTGKPQRTPTTISPPTRAFSGPSTLSSSPSEKFSIMQDNNRKKNPTPAYSRRRHDAILDALTKNRLEHHRLLQEERKLEGWTDGIICDRRMEMQTTT